MNVYQRYMSISEPYAAGFFEDETRSLFYRFSKAHYRFMEHCPLSKFNGGELYPCGAMAADYNKIYAIYPQFSRTYEVDYDFFDKKDKELSRFCLENMPQRERFNLDKKLFYGTAYAHGTPNFSRILKEGLNSYRQRIENCKDADFKEGCLLIIASMELFKNRCVEYLKTTSCPEKLIKALSKVPFEPAESFYEAVVAYGFIYYMDLCDNLGQLEKTLLPYYKGEDAYPLLRELFLNVEASSGWDIQMGPQKTPLSISILRAARGLCRPQVQLFISKDTAPELFDEACDMIASGSANPALYNYELYLKKVRERFPAVSAKDLERLCFCGCTETCLDGISRVGSTDAYYNTLELFSRYLRAELEKKADFSSFYQGYLEAFQNDVDIFVRRLNECYKIRAGNLPHPLRTVLIDDCIDKETDYNAGGARYSWGIFSFSGMVNTLEGMLAVRELVYEKKQYSPREFLLLLDSQDPELYLRLRKCPHYGVDDDSADELGKDLFSKFFSCLDEKESYFGYGYLSSSIHFTTYVAQGKHVKATPCGRKASEPLCDSLAPIMSNDKMGATACLNSISKLPLSKALGTPVVNLRLDPKTARQVIKPLTLSFFERGGMQLQITCVSSEDMKDAMLHPEKHGNLLVRTAGYVEYFTRLDKRLQETIIARTDHQN